jgi:AmmeMemoRadiSam system protein A
MADPASAENRSVDTTRVLELEFDADQAARLTDAARECVRSAAAGEKAEGRPGKSCELPPELADLPVFGLFVTLYRGDELRACLGNWGREETMSLGELIHKVARSTATSDHRFPRIQPGECDTLSVELSLMTSPEVMEEQGQALIDAIRIGTDGLHIQHPRGRGLLLPNVASEHGWDAATLLERLCAKARLPRGAWRESECSIERFQTILVRGAPKTPEFDPRLLGPPTMRALVQTAISALRGDPPPAGQEADPELDAPQAEELGIQLGVAGDDPALCLGRGKSLRELVRAAAAEVRGEKLTELVILWHGIDLVAADAPQRHGSVQDRALVTVRGDQRHLQPGSRDQGLASTLPKALEAVGADPDAWRRNEVRVLACAAVALQVRAPGKAPAAKAPAAKVPAAKVPAVRTTAVAGRFYPGEVEEMQQQLHHHLRFTAAREAWRAIMLPHAGWRFCGDIIGETLARVEVPRRVILIGPRHHPRGAEWSIAPHRAWQVPGSEIPIDQDLVGALCDAVPGLTREPQAHVAEHGAEVLLPFLLQLQPDLRVAPMAIGHASYADIQHLAAGLQTVLNQESEPPRRPTGAVRSL